MELTVHDAIGLGDRSPAVVACSLDDTVAKVMRQFVQEHNPAYGNDFVFVHCGNRVGLIDGRDAREDATLRDFGLEVTPSVQVVSGFRWPGEDRGDNVAGATGADGDAGSASTTFKLNVCGGLPLGPTVAHMNSCARSTTRLPRSCSSLRRRHRGLQTG